MWAAMPEIAFCTAQDSKTLLYMFGRVRFIRRISWQTLDGWRGGESHPHGDPPFNVAARGERHDVATLSY
jgi:hypothetical protein